MARQGFDDRWERALPHVGAVVASYIWYRLGLALGEGLELADERYGLGFYVVLMAAPVGGALATLRAQRAPAGLRSPAVWPYVRWFGAGCVFLLALGLEGRATFLNGSPIGIAVIAAALLMLLLVPFVVPVLRLIRWIVWPPATNGDD